MYDGVGAAKERLSNVSAYLNVYSCPWTGTAIGSKNMLAFQCFVALVFICLMFDIILLTGGIR
jgi:hypothetical protein